MTVNRRQFVQGAAGAAAAAGAWGAVLGAVARAEKEPPVQSAAALPLVDTHQHLWDLTRLRLPWIRHGEPLDRSFLVKDYLEAAQGLNIVKAVYMEVAVGEGQEETEAQYVLDLCRHGQTPCAAVIGGRPAAEGFRRYVTRFKGNPYLKGVRQVRPKTLAERAFAQGVQLLGEYGLCFDLCVPPGELAIATRLVDDCPHTRFVLDHCGNPDPKAFRRGASAAGGEKPAAGSCDPEQWRQDIDRLARRKHVVCKISGLISQMPAGKWSAEDLAPVINHCLEAFGPDRVMFAGDWPVCTRGGSLRQWVEALRQVVRDRPEGHQRKLFHDNAVRFYGL